MNADNRKELQEIAQQYAIAQVTFVNISRVIQGKLRHLLEAEELKFKGANAGLRETPTADQVQDSISALQEVLEDVEENEPKLSPDFRQFRHENTASDTIVVPEDFPFVDVKPN